MSWTHRVAPVAAGPELAAIYSRIRARSSSGGVSHFWQAWGAQPELLEAVFALHGALLDRPVPLTPAQAEMIAIAVSATNGCAYCVSHHGPRLASLVGEALARKVALDYRGANLAARDRVLLDAAVALTCEPDERGQADVERLREYGFDEPAIVKATALAAWFNFVNRVVLALGIEPEPGLGHWESGRPA